MGHLGRTQKSQAASEKKLKAYACELEQKLEARTRELAEAREQQTATSEVLRVISSSSPGDLKPVFKTMLANATRLCEAEFVLLQLRDGEFSRIAAVYNLPPALAATQNVPFRIHPKAVLPRFAEPRKSCKRTTSERCRHISKAIRGWSLSPTSA